MKIQLLPEKKKKREAFLKFFFPFFWNALKNYWSNRSVKNNRPHEQRHSASREKPCAAGQLHSPNQANFP
ncbi:hypothetical protein HHJ03_05985 [Akkermansia muciniphila]|uniref:hypothetical protein n=1 Tax=Akkermansia sp. TaxID=1872421 RepID=UPI001CA5BCD1|nr:hypothetical protein [Akkermansia muciniphila]